MKSNPLLEEGDLALHHSYQALDSKRKEFPVAGDALQAWTLFMGSEGIYSALTHSQGGINVEQMRRWMTLMGRNHFDPDRASAVVALLMANGFIFRLPKEHLMPGEPEDTYDSTEYPLRADYLARQERSRRSMLGRLTRVLNAPISDLFKPDSEQVAA